MTTESLTIEAPNTIRASFVLLDGDIQMVGLLLISPCEYDLLVTRKAGIITWKKYLYQFNFFRGVSKSRFSCSSLNLPQVLPLTFLKYRIISWSDILVKSITNF